MGGAGAAAAQGADEIISTAPPEVTLPAPTQLDLTTPRTSTAIASETAPETATSAAIVEEAARAETQRRTGERTIVELSDDASIVSRPVGASDATGGLLRNNSDLNRPNRKSLGFAFKF